MRITPLIILLVAITTLAGCTDDGGPGVFAPEDDTTDLKSQDSGGSTSPNTGTNSSPRTSTSPNATDGDTTEAGPTFAEVDIRLEGNLGTRAIVCEDGTLNSCSGVNAIAGNRDLLLEQPGATLVGAEITLEWTASSPVTQQLGIGLMRMGTNSTFVENQEGTSPLTISLQDLDLVMDEDNLVHIYVYNPTLLLHQDPLIGYISVDEQFTVSGTLTFLS